MISSTPDVIVRHVEKDGSKILFDVVQKSTATDFTVTVYAEDIDKVRSTESVTLRFALPKPHAWEYNVTQGQTGGFVTRPVGRRTDVTHMLIFKSRPDLDFQGRSPVEFPTTRTLTTWCLCEWQSQWMPSTL